MIRERCIALDTPVEWRNALKQVQHGFGHTWENCYAMQLTTGFNTYLYCFETENVRIICPISERLTNGCVHIVTPYGFSGFAGNCDFTEFRTYWNAFTKKKNYVSGYIALNPIFENDTYFDSSDVHQSNSLYFLDLTPSLDELFTNLDNNRKRQLKTYKQFDGNLVFDKEILTDFFLANYPDFIKRVHASRANCFSRNTLAYLCNLDNVIIVGAGEGNRLQAVCLFAYTHYAADFLFNVALPEGRKWAVMLVWAGLEYLKSINVPVLNLGGGVREDDSIARSKQRYGALRRPFRCLKQVYKPLTFQMLCRRFNADPDNRSGYFPPFARPSSTN